MSEGISASLPAQLPQTQAADRGHRGRTSRDEGERFNSLLDRSHSAGGSAGRGNGIDNGEPADGKVRDNTVDEGDLGDGSAPIGLPGTSTGYPGTSAGGGSGFATGGGTDAGLPDDGGKAPPNLVGGEPRSRMPRIDGEPSLPANPGPGGIPGNSGQLPVEPNQGLRATLLGGAAAGTPDAGAQSAQAARWLLELAGGAGQAKSGDPLTALQQALAARSGGVERSAAGSAAHDADDRKRVGPAPGEGRARPAGVDQETLDVTNPRARVEEQPGTSARDGRGDGNSRSLPNNPEGRPFEIGGGKVDLIGTQNVPPPSMLSPGSTSAALVGSLDADGTWKSMISEAATLASNAGRRGGEVVKSINIQLQPLSLGTVTAKLSVQGDQIQVDLKVENADARQRLASDGDSIVKSLRALGYEVDRVTVQHVQQPSANAAAQNAPGRGSAFQPEAGNGGASGGQAQGGDGNQSGNGGEGYGGSSGQSQANAGRDGVYI